MVKQTSFAHQRQVLENFVSLLSSLESSMLELAQKYEQEIIALYEEQGLMDEIYTGYMSKHLRPTKSALEELANNISTKDLPFVEKELDFIASREDFI